LLACGASFFALAVIALGAFTRLMDAGLGCPDWPGCYGHLVVPLSKELQQAVNIQYPATPLIAYKAWAEMVHRYFVGGLSLLILTIIAIILTQKKVRHQGNILLSIVLVGLLAYQIMLGQWTVTLKLLPVIVSQHLLGGFLILTTLWIVYLNNSNQIHKMQSTRMMSFLSILGLVLLLLQISLGAWTSTNYASLSCPDFPFCINDQTLSFHFKEAFNLFSPIGVNYEGGVLPEVIRQTIQMTHRFGALILSVYLFIFLLIAQFKLKQSPAVLKLFYLMLGLLIIQLCLGMANVIFKLPLATAISHTVAAALLLLTLVTITFKLTQKVSA
jgi:cytochrome c oxidase assembly protein subunit 15